MLIAFNGTTTPRISPSTFPLFSFQNSMSYNMLRFIWIISIYIRRCGCLIHNGYLCVSVCGETRKILEPILVKHISEIEKCASRFTSTNRMKLIPWDDRRRQQQKKKNYCRTKNTVNSIIALYFIQTVD